MDKNPYDGAYFEGRSSNYWWTVGSYKNLGRFPHWEEMLRLIKELKGKGKLLDVGCAYGFLVKTASAHFESYGIDISNFAVKKSRGFCNEGILMASAVSLPFKSECFDVITVIDTLEHITELTQCIEDIRRVLKKGGVLFLQLPNPLIWRYFSGLLRLGDESHANDFWLKGWKKFLSKNKLRVERCFGMLAFAYKKIRFLIKSERNASLFPEWWVIARK